MRPADAQRAVVAAATAVLLALSFGALAQGGELAHRHRPARVIASDRSVDPPSDSQPDGGAPAPMPGLAPESAPAAGSAGDPDAAGARPGTAAVRPSPSSEPPANDPDDDREAVDSPVRDDDDEDDDDDRETVRPPVRDDDDHADDDDDDDDSDDDDDTRLDGKKGKDGNEESSADRVRDSASRSHD